jgi:hypothetical protein
VELYSLANYIILLCTSGVLSVVWELRVVFFLFLFKFIIVSSTSEWVLTLDLFSLRVEQNKIRAHLGYYRLF